MSQPKFYAYSFDVYANASTFRPGLKNLNKTLKEFGTNMFIDGRGCEFTIIDVYNKPIGEEKVDEFKKKYLEIFDKRFPDGEVEVQVRFNTIEFDDVEIMSDDAKKELEKISESDELIQIHHDFKSNKLNYELDI